MIPEVFSERLNSGPKRLCNAQFEPNKNYQARSQKKVTKGTCKKIRPGFSLNLECLLACIKSG